MSLILKHLVSFIYVVFSGVSTSLSSFNVRVFLFFDGFLLVLLFLVVFFFDLLSIAHFYTKEKKLQKKPTKNKKNKKKNLTAQYLLCA